MLRTILLHRARALLLEVDLRCVRPAASKFFPTKVLNYQFRSFSRRPKDGKSSASTNVLPEAPSMSPEEIDFIEELAREGVKDFSYDSDALEGNGDTQDLPEAPKLTPSEWEVDILEEDEEPGEEIEPVPYFPPVKKFEKNAPEYSHLLSLSSGSKMSKANISRMDDKSSEVQQPMVGLELDPTVEILLKADPSLQQVIDAWAQALDTKPATSPMPLYALANRSTKIKELVKLGVDFSKIADRHGDLERLLHLNWEDQIKIQIRFLVDCGIQPSCLGDFLTRNTQLLWTDKDDLQVRINYLEAKLFTADQINKILNKAPFWLTLSTKELDGRLGFLQRTFKLPGNEVRLIASSFPTIVSSQKWSIFVDTTKLMDREFGFKDWERKKLLFTTPQCYMRPTTVRKSFDLCHNQIGLPHHQLVKHATLLVNRVNRMKPRHEFLKFLKRDIFNVWDPMYISPDWLWKGTVEEFCENAAKRTVEEYEHFLKHSATAM